MIFAFSFKIKILPQCFILRNHSSESILALCLWLLLERNALYVGGLFSAQVHFIFNASFLTLVNRLI